MGDDLKLTDSGMCSWEVKAAGRQLISSLEYAMLLSIFFIGYLICEVPSNLLLTRSRPSFYLPGLMIVWGTICSCMSAAHNYEGMLAMRFFLGCIEAGFFPGVLYVMTCWYKKAEIGKHLLFPHQDTWLR